MDGTYGTHGRYGKFIPYHVLVQKPEGKTALASLRHIWEDIIEMNLEGIWFKGADWINLRQNGYQ
jgi:hypothetical protein